MADWIRCTAFPSESVIFVNLDNVAVMAAHDRGASIVLTSGDEYAVNEPPEELIGQLAVRHHA